MRCPFNPKNRVTYLLFVLPLFLAALPPFPVSAAGVHHGMHPCVIRILSDLRFPVDYSRPCLSMLDNIENNPVVLPVRVFKCLFLLLVFSNAPSLLY